MRFDLGFLTVEWKRGTDTRPRKNGRPAPLTDQDRWDRAEEAAYWILKRHWMGAPYSRRRRPSGMTEQAYNHGYKLLHLAEVMYKGEMLYQQEQSDTAKGGIRLTINHTKEQYLKQKLDNPSIVLPF